MSDPIAVPAFVYEACQRQLCHFCQAKLAVTDISSVGVRRMSDGRICLCYETICPACHQSSMTILPGRPVGAQNWYAQLARWVRTDPAPKALPVRKARQRCRSKQSSGSEAQDHVVSRTVDLLDCWPGHRGTLDGPPCSVITMAQGEQIDCIQFTLADSRRLVYGLLRSLAHADDKRAGAILNRYFAAEQDPGDDDDDNEQDSNWWRRAT